MAKKLDLEKLSLEELKALQKETAKAVEGYEERKRAEAIAELEAVAAKHGYKLKDLLGGKPTKTKAKGEPKYRHPENPAKTWTGKGRQPAWIKEGLEAGKSIEDFAI
ncbi:H-NS family nucleoid-associated regulatory protein [Hasllibacter sp. MH4015]|uniref:H-NS histone family protein n=1 Tax=Hasllibacter sp. MH4015 TaxID=2854029 RepID=UPI001CD7034C|nr:H-NS histone family protein [Hasllibacter sp. MH4015]